MSELSRQARRAMRAKIHRITKGESGKVDASDYGPEEVLDAGVKTGMRPISRRAFKKGGKVVANEGKDAVKHAGKTPRGKPKHLTVDALVNRNVKDANEEREGVKHIGGLKTGGRAKKAGGGWSEGERYIASNFKHELTPEKVAARNRDAQHQRNIGNTSDQAKNIRKGAVTASRLSRLIKDEGLKTGGRAKKEGGGPLSTMGGDLYGLRNNPNPNRSTLLKKGGRACKEGGGRLDEPRSGGATIDSTTQKFRAAAAKAEADRVARTGNASAQDPRYRAVLGTDRQIVARGNAEPYEPMPRKAGGKAAKFEGTPKDVREDKKLAKKHHMSMKEWEASSLDAKHDKQRSTKGLKRGGEALDGKYQGTRPTGGRIAKKDGGSLSGLELATGGRAKKSGKTNINIVIGTGQRPPMAPGLAPGMPQPPAGGIPVPVPGAAAGAPPMPPMPPMPAAAPAPMAMPGAGPAPMARKRGGRTYRSYKDMDAGAGSGLGRLEKTEIQKHKK